MKLEYSPRLERDLEEIADYIARDNPLAADRVVTGLRTKCLRIAERPQLYPVLADNGIWFQVLGAKLVRIERVVHGARDISALF